MQPLEAQAGTSQRMAVAASVIIALAVLAVYANSLRAPFIFDDTGGIIENPAIRHLWRLGPMLTAPRPVATFTLAVNYAIGRLDPLGYHLVNIGIHLAAALLLFGLVRRTLLTPRLRERFAQAATPLAFAIALLWAVHPLQTESVTYTIQRSESLMGLFYLLTLYAIARAAESARPRRWHVLAVAACAFGMGTKEVMASAPLVALLYDRLFLAGSFREALRRRWGLYLAMTATWALLIPPIIQAGNADVPAAGFSTTIVTPFTYAATQCSVILHYLRLSFWPAPLCLDYGWPWAQRAAEIIPGALVIAVWLAATLLLLRRASAWAFPLAAFLLTLAPTSSIMPIADACFEHRMYLSLAALIAGVVIGAYCLGARIFSYSPQARHAAFVLVAIMAIALGAATWLRNTDYASEVRIWEQNVSARPENPRACSSLSLAYSHQKRYDDAIAACQMAIALKSNFADAYNNLGTAYYHKGMNAAALAAYNASLEIRPSYVDAYVNRAALYTLMGNRDAAMADYNKAIELAPEKATAYRGRGTLYEHLGRPEDALRDYSTALSLRPDLAEAAYNRGNIHLDAGRLDLAKADYDLAIADKPDYAEAYANRAVIWLQQGNRPRARADLEQCKSLGGKPPAELIAAVEGR